MQEPLKVLAIFLCIVLCYQNVASADTEDVTKELERLLKNAKSSDPAVQLEAIIQVRNMVAGNDENRPIDDVIKAGFLPILIKEMQSEYSKIQVQSLWALAGIAAGNTEQTTSVVDAGATPILIKLLSSEDQDILHPAIWTLGNIIGNGDEHRDMAIELGVVEPVLKLAKSAPSLNFRRELSRLLANLVSIVSSPVSLNVAEEVLHVFKDFLHQNDTEILFRSMRGIAYISQSGSEYIQMIIDAGVVPDLVSFLKHKESDVHLVSLLILVNLSAGNDNQTQTVLDAGVLDYVPYLLNLSNYDVTEGVMRLTSNIAAGTTGQIQRIIDADLLPTLMNFSIQGDGFTQKKAVQTISNFAWGGTTKQVEKLLETGVLAPLCVLLGVDDLNIVTNVLHTLNNIIEKLPERREEILSRLVVCEGLETVKKLMTNENDTTKALAIMLLDKLGVIKSNSAAKWLMVPLKKQLF